MAGKNFNFSKSARTAGTGFQAQSTVLSLLSGAGGQAQYQIVALDLLDACPLQPRFYSVNKEKMQSLADSIRLKGVLQPIVLRTKPDGRYEILAGHCRTEASRMAGKETIPAMVYQQLDDASAEYIFHVTNLEDGHDLPPSERARGYAAVAKLLAEKGLPNGQSTAGVAKETGVDVRTVQRYNRLARLDAGLLEKVDAGQVSVRAGAQLSYLPEKQQAKVAQELENGGTITEEQAVAMRRKAKQAVRPAAIRKLDFTPFAKFFPPDATKREVEQRILEALALWEAQQR